MSLLEIQDPDYVMVSYVVNAADTARDLKVTQIYT